MDKVFNSEASIASAKKALSVFEENIMATANSTTNDLHETLSKLDDKYKNEIVEFTEQINVFVRRVNSFVVENTKALEQREKRIVEYDSNSYKKRNIL